MSVDDDQSGESRFDRAIRAVDERRSSLEKDFRIENFVFAERIDPVTSGTLKGIQPTGKMTLIPKAVREAVGRFSRESTPLVFLFSDGIENGGGGEGSEPSSLRTSGGRGGREGHYTLHTIGVGSNLRDNPEFRDIQIIGMEAPAQVSVRNRMTINATIRAIGLDGRVVKAQLFDGQTPLGEQELTLTSTQTGESLSFEHVPTTPGRHTYTIQVEPVAGEALTLNNVRSVTAVVLSKKIRVLYVEGSMRPEYGGITDRFLAKDPDLEFCTLLRTKAGAFTRRSNVDSHETLPESAEDFAKSDVFILGDFDASYWKEGALDHLVERLREGAGLIMIGGSHTLGGGGYAESALAPVAPVDFGPRSIGDVKIPFLPQLTPEGRVHPIFANIVGFFPTQTSSPTIPGLPELNGCSRIVAARPGATVLATLPLQFPGGDHEIEENEKEGGSEADDESGDGDRIVGSVRGESVEMEGGSEGAMPVLAVQPVGEGRFAVFCGDTTRNWQQAPAVLGQESPFIRFWGQMVRWAAGREDSTLSGRTTLLAEVDRPQYALRDPISITATLRAADGEGIANAPVTVKLYRRESVDATTGGLIGDTTGSTIGDKNGTEPEAELTMAPVAGSAGRYTATYHPTGSGWLEIVVSASGL
ncbi:MAG: hypothetical protein Q4C47_08815, partial [Planctomycetia bacterium]|nr:hypothetical protein [Planctomycetia bacterium]